MGSQAQDAALGAGFGLLRLPACVIKVNTAHCALCHCLPPPPRTSSASAHPCSWAGAGVSSGNGCAAPALHPPVEAACPGARPWRGHNSQGLALSFPCLWFQRNFLHFFSECCPARLGRAGIYIWEYTSTCWTGAARTCRTRCCIQASAVYPRNLHP